MTAKILAVPGRKIARAPAGEQAASANERPKGLAPCLFYLFIEFARPMDWVHPLAVIKPGMIAALWGLFAVIRSKSRPIPRPVWYMFGLVALMAWQVPWAVNNAWAFWGFQDFAFLVVGCVLPLAVLPKNLAAVRYLLTAYVLLHVPMAVHGILYGGRGLTGWMGDENDLALALNIAIGLAIYLFLETSNNSKKMLLLAAIGVMVAGVVASISRGGFVGLASLALFLFLLGPRRGTVALCVLLATVGLYFFAPDRYWGEVRSIRTASQPGDTGEERMYLWGMAWRMFLDHPITGVGTQNFGIQAPYYEDSERAETSGYHTWGRVAHSLYFTLIAEQGFIGAALFAAILSWFLMTTRRLRRLAKTRPDDLAARSAALLATGLAAGLLAFLVTGAFLTVTYYPLFWVLAGLMGSLDAVATAPDAGVA